MENMSKQKLYQIVDEQTKWTTNLKGPERKKSSGKKIDSEEYPGQQKLEGDDQRQSNGKSLRLEDASENFHWTPGASDTGKRKPLKVLLWWFFCINYPSQYPSKDIFSAPYIYRLLH